MGFDLKKNLAKGAWGVGYGLLAIGGQAILAHLSDSAAVASLLTAAGIDPALVPHAAPVIVGLAAMARNYAKHAA